MRIYENIEMILELKTNNYIIRLSSTTEKDVYIYESYKINKYDDELCYMKFFSDYDKLYAFFIKKINMTDYTK